MFIDLRETERERQKNRERKRETSMWKRNIDPLPPIYALNRDQTHNLGIWPEQVSNVQPLDAQGDAPTNWAAQPELYVYFLLFISKECFLGTSCFF